jgi:hypothetical protein
MPYAGPDLELLDLSVLILDLRHVESKSNFSRNLASLAQQASAKRDKHARCKLVARLAVAPNDCGIIDVPQNLLVCGVGEVWPGSDSSARTKRRRDEFAATAIMSF